MWKHQEATNLLTRLFLLFVLYAHLLKTARALSDKRLCADEHCNEIISTGHSTLNYNAGEEGIVSFKANVAVRIFSKAAGSDPSLWGIEIENQRGYAPKRFIREDKIIIPDKDLKFEVSVEQKTMNPVLSTSEKFIGQKSTTEAATTKPLNLTPAESSEHLLTIISNKKISGDNVPVATPVVDVTKPPISSNSDGGNAENIKDDGQSSSKTADVNEKGVQDSTKPKIDSEINFKSETRNEAEGETSEVKFYEGNTKIEVQKVPTETSSEANSVDNGSIDGEYLSANQASFDGSDPVVKDEQTNLLENSQNNLGNEEIKLTIDNIQNNAVQKDTKKENEKRKIELGSIYNSTEMNTTSSTIAPDQEQTNNRIVNLDNELKTTQIEMNSKAIKKAVRETSETTNQQAANYKSSASDEKKSDEYTIVKQEVKAQLNEPYSENALENEKSISELTGAANKSIEAEVGRTNDNATLEAPKEVSESLVVESTAVNDNSFNRSDLAGKDQKADVLDEVNFDEGNKTIEGKGTTSSEANGVVNGSLPGDYPSANQTSFDGGDPVVKDEQTNLLENSQNNLRNEEIKLTKDNIPINAVQKDTKEENEKVKSELGSIYNSSEMNTTSSTIAPDQEQTNNGIVNLDIELNTIQVEKNLGNESSETKEFEPEKENENPIQSDGENYDKITDSFSVGNAGSSTAKETVSESSVSSKSDTGSKRNYVEEFSDESQKNYETITNKSEEYLNETNSNLEDNKRNTSEIDAQKLTSTDDSASNPQHIGGTSPGLIKDSNALNVHNQQDIINEADKAVVLQQSKRDTVKQTDNINSFSTETITDYKEAKAVDSAETGFLKEKMSSSSVLNTEEPSLNKIYQTAEKKIQGKGEVVENINPTTLTADIAVNTPLPTYQDDISTNVPPNHNHGQHFELSQEDFGSISSESNVPTTTVNVDVQRDKKKDENSKVTPSLDILEPKKNKGLFATIMGTVNNMWTNNGKKQPEFDGYNELNRILFSQGDAQKNNIDKLNEESFPYCKNIEPNGDCPESSDSQEHSTSSLHHTASTPLPGADLIMEDIFTTMASKILEMSELIAFLAIAAAASLFFVFGYYCFCNSSREGALLLKLNQLESSLLASHKENTILKHNLMSTRQKLASIEDNSFGSNDMVASLKKELEEELLEKARLQEQITVLQKELENAADAGIELNKIVSELLSNQTGDESIISSVEELQKQLNEQQNTIYEINASLAEKSRENSELQLMIAEQNARYAAELANVQRDNDELEHEKGSLLTRLEEMKTDFNKDITAALEGKNMEIKRLQNDILDLTNKVESEHTKWQTSVAKIEALEECLKNVRRDPKVNISEVIDVANVKAQLIEAQKMYQSLKERFETELDSRKLAENQLAVVSAEVEKLKQDFNQSEKDKLEAQTRLEVLSNYFKDKENQLQKELSLKEAMWLKQQGETTTTVDRVTAMQDEIQSLKSQNDSLRAEIEAQLAAHKAQIGTLENRAHETWLAARQSDRRYEEARAEAVALRRKLTALAGGNVNESNKPSAGPVALGDELTQAPSPIHMEPPGSPMQGRLPPPPPFLPPPFMGPPPPFMGMPPPPPFVPPGEMRPAPLGRIMSPPPQRSGRFSPNHLDYEDYMDYEGNNTWHRYTYSPPPRTYRSLSPSDSRYNYGTERDLMSTYDTETDFSPPPSPRETRRRVGNSSEKIDSSTKMSYGNTNKFSSSNKAPLSSRSEKPFNTHSNNNTKPKKGNSTVGGKNLV